MFLPSLFWERNPTITGIDSMKISGGFRETASSEIEGKKWGKAKAFARLDPG